MSSYIRVLVPGIVLALTFAGRVAAAPQILGLVASDEPMPLTCADGVCAAEFTAFCLQRERYMPEPGTAYRPAAGTELTLTVTRPDGTKRAVAAGGSATIESRRDYHAVRIAIPQAAIQALGGGQAALAVGRRASLVPVARPGDDAPLDAAEIAYVTGPHRVSVEETLETGNETVATARIVDRLINALPKGRVSAARRESLWRTVIGDAPAAGASTPLHAAAREYRTCRRWADTGLGDGLRRCLEQFHDSAMTGFTRKVWDMNRPGS